MFKVDFDAVFGERVCVHRQEGKLNERKGKL